MNEVREAVERYRRVKAGENCYMVYLPERFDERGIVFKPWSAYDEREYIDRRRADIELLASAFVDKWFADGAAKEAEI
jgi:hypothetical protein